MSLTVVATHLEFRESSLNETPWTSLVRKKSNVILSRRAASAAGKSRNRPV